MKIPSNLGMLLLSIFLILHGAIQALSLSFSYSNYIVGGLALASGILLLLRR